MGRRKRNVVPWLVKLKKTPTLSQGQSDLVKWVFLVSRKPPHPISFQFWEEKHYYCSSFIFKNLD